MSTLRNDMIRQMELKGYSSRTITSYISSILSLAVYYNTSPDLLTEEQIRQYLHQGITKKKLSRSWLNQLISALKILYCDVLKREWNRLDIPRPRRQRKLPVVLSKQEVKQLIDATINLKHRAMLTLTYSAGLRLSEVRNLKVQDIDSNRMLVRVRQAKGFKDRYTILSPVALRILREFWKRYHPKVWLFEIKPGQQPSHRTITYTFKKALRKAGIQKQVGIHALRHSFATHLLEQGVSLPIIQQLLGHRSLRTTSGYLHVQQYSIHAVKSPLDTLAV